MEKTKARVLAVIDATGERVGAQDADLVAEIESGRPGPIPSGATLIRRIREQEADGKAWRDSLAELGPDADPLASIARILGAKGGKATAARLTPEQRQERARKAGQARWAKRAEERCSCGHLRLEHARKGGHVCRWTLRCLCQGFAKRAY